MSFRVGIGYDLHAFESGGKLILGGVEIPYQSGLRGHSDADVLLHSISDALLGAAALGDIGHHFPDTDPAYKNANSMKLLENVRQMLTDQQYEVVNVDATIIAESPKMQSHINEMRKNISTALGCEVSQISVKATTNEKLDAIGRKEGIAVHSVVLLNKR